MRRQVVTTVLAAGTLGAFVLAAGIFRDTAPALGWALVLLGVVLLLAASWALRIGLRPHPHMRRHAVVRLSPGRLRALARSGEPFELPLGRSESVTVVVRPAGITADAAELIVARAGEEPGRRPVAEDPTFAGSVVGREGSVVRLTITDAWLQGYVRTASDWWFVEPLRKFRLDAEFDEYVVYRTRDLRFKLEFGDDFKPRKVEQGGAGGVEPPHRVNPIVPICMVHDEDYSSQAAGNPYDHQRALINDVNGIYAAIGCEFRITVFIWTVNWLTSTKADRMLDQVEDVVRSVWTDLRQVANRRSHNTEVAHATTGKNLDGNTLGIAWQPGVYGISQQQPGGQGSLAFQNLMIAAHELGHNFDGSHDEGDEWCVAHFIWCWDFVRTIMWPTIYGDSVPRFSAGDRDPSHNNEQRISTNMASGRNGNF